MIELKECTINDIKILAELNKQLIKDEKANNKMDINNLENRMKEFLNNGYKAYFLKTENDIIGYALCDITKNPIYLRQYFIKKEERRKHYGKLGFRKLIELLGVDKMEIDVYKWNSVGIKFWESLGFIEQWKRMKYTKE